MSSPKITSRANKHPEWQTTRRERSSYYIYFTGQGSIYMLVSTFLTTYLLMSGIDPAMSAGVMLAVKIWDALNDAIFGAMFDMVKFKSKQKFVPWLKIASVAVPITTVFLFLLPSVVPSQASKLALFAVAYILWDTAYTLCDAPAFGIITVLTERQDERTSMQSYKSIWGAAGSGIALLLGYLLVSEGVGLPYWVPALICAIIAIFMMNPLAFKVKENTKLYETEEKFTLRRMFKYLMQNKYLLIFYLGFLFYSGFGVAQSLSTFASFYLFNNSLFALLIMGLSVVPMLICALFVPKIIHKLDKMKLFRICGIFSVLMKFIIFFVGYKNVWLYLGLAVIDSVPLAIMGVILFMFTPDCAEYGKFKTGIDAKGITFSIQTFMAKLTAAVSGSLGLFMLGFFGWRTVEAESFADLKAMGAAAAQTPQALSGLWITYTLIPAIGVTIAIIIWFFYRLGDKDVQIMADANSGLISREDALKQLKIKFKPDIAALAKAADPMSENNFSADDPDRIGIPSDFAQNTKKKEDSEIENSWEYELPDTDYSDDYTAEIDGNEPMNDTVAIITDPDDFTELGADE